MKKPIIEVRGVGKKYDIRHMRGGYIALRDVVMNVIKSPFSFLKSKAKQVVGLEKKEEFWALKDISFEVNKGEVVGIIGANGAGKSTLLKILSQITPPTEGEIILRGRVGSLLEVGTGFHPELSGRENIFLNGAILGMKRREIEEKFDQIVKFAGIEKFLDTPVKYYSSGMYVRLAFSVAAHMEPDILLVDEVLAVGDAEFQKKCLGKMNEITKTEGRTILFVSHNLTAIRNLCHRSILLENGKVAYFGSTEEAINKYLLSPRLSLLENVGTQNRRKRTNGAILFSQVISLKTDGSENKTWTFNYKESIRFEIKCKVKNKKEKSDGLTFFVTLNDIESGIPVTSIRHLIIKEDLLSNQDINFTLTLPPQSLRSGQYRIYFAIANKDESVWYDVVDENVNLPPLSIQSENNDEYYNYGFFAVPYEISKIEKK